MSAYTHKNLQDLDNIGAERHPGFEARFGRNPLNTEHLGVSFFRYPAGYKSGAGHRHREQEEAYVVVEGSGRMKLGEDVIELRQWDVVRVAPQTVRAFEGGPDGLAFIAIGADRPEGGDGESVSEFWVD